MAKAAGGILPHAAGKVARVIRQRVLPGGALAALGKAQRVFAPRSPRAASFRPPARRVSAAQAARVARARKRTAHPAYLGSQRVHNLGLKQKHLYGFCTLPQCVQALGCFIVFVEFRPNGAIPLFHQFGCHGLFAHPSFHNRTRPIPSACPSLQRPAPAGMPAPAGRQAGFPAAPLHPARPETAPNSRRRRVFRPGGPKVCFFRRTSVSACSVCRMAASASWPLLCPAWAACASCPACACSALSAGPAVRFAPLSPARKGACSSGEASPRCASSSYRVSCGRRSVLPRPAAGHSCATARPNIPFAAGSAVRRLLPAPAGPALRPALRLKVRFWRLPPPPQAAPRRRPPPGRAAAPYPLRRAARPRASAHWCACRPARCPPREPYWLLPRYWLSLRAFAASAASRAICAGVFLRQRRHVLIHRGRKRHLKELFQPRRRLPGPCLARRLAMLRPAVRLRLWWASASACPPARLRGRGRALRAAALPCFGLRCLAAFTPGRLASAFHRPAPCAAFAPFRAFPFRCTGAAKATAPPAAPFSQVSRSISAAKSSAKPLCRLSLSRSFLLAMLPFLPFFTKRRA